jgi:beta-galactosidase
MNQPADCFMRKTFLMNQGWRFIQDDLEERNFESIHRAYFKAPEWIKAGNHGLSKPGYPDQDWEAVDLPHDFIQNNPFTPDAEVSHGSLQKGVAWYRKTFHLPAEDAASRILIEFDGVFRDSKVWINGHFAKQHLSGYTGFCCDITDCCNFGGYNTLAVRADARLAELWSYEGGGIYRDVRMVKTSPVHVDGCGVFVRGGADGLILETTLRNDSDRPVECEVCSTVLDPSGNSLLCETALLPIAPEACAVLSQFSKPWNPVLWSTENPYLYTLKTTVHCAGQIVDETTTSFGVREICFDAKKGFFLNGQPLKLRGICNHQDHAGVGTAIPDSLLEWRMLQMKAMGANALRVAHNPPSPALLNLCDRLGILVIDETRLTGSAPELLGQLEDLIRRDRNHPSVILWSIGNEEMNIQHTQSGIRQLRRMQNLVHRLDPTRPATYAMNCHWVDIADTYEKAGFRLDVFGANYLYTDHGVDERLYDDFHRKHPDTPLIASESGGSAATRGLYETEYYEGRPLALHDFGRDGVIWTGDHLKGVVSAYNNALTPWGSPMEEVWKHCAERDFLAGTFLWTGFDYRGETYPYGWPSVVTRFGLMDLCGFPKDAYFYYKSQWNPEPMLHLFPHWSWPGKEGMPVVVRAYTNCAEVELLLNGRLITRKKIEKYGFFETTVAYEPGCLEAIGFAADGKEILRASQETAGSPAALEITPHRNQLAADSRDTAVCNVRVTDREGRTVPDAEPFIRFSLSGPGKILGTGNGNPVSHEAPKAPQCRAFHGLCQVLVQTGTARGELILTAESEGLPSCSVRLNTSTPATRLPDLPGILVPINSIHAKANPVDGIL